MTSLCVPVWATSTNYRNDTKRRTVLKILDSIVEGIPGACETFLFDDTSGEKVFSARDYIKPSFLSRSTTKTRCGVTNLAILRKQNINSFGMMRETNVLVDLNWIKLWQLEMKLSRRRRGGAKCERNVCGSEENMNWWQFGGKWSSIVDQEYMEAFPRVKQGSSN